VLRFSASRSEARCSKASSTIARACRRTAASGWRSAAARSGNKPMRGFPRRLWRAGGTGTGASRPMTVARESGGRRLRKPEQLDPGRPSLGVVPQDEVLPAEQPTERAIERYILETLAHRAPVEQLALDDGARLALDGGHHLVQRHTLEPHAEPTARVSDERCRSPVRSMRGHRHQDRQEPREPNGSSGPERCLRTARFPEGTAHADSVRQGSRGRNPPKRGGRRLLREHDAAVNSGSDCASLFARRRRRPQSSGSVRC
jgi:hypothetical protein